MAILRTRVKICGITRAQDALIADELGVDALGFVFVPASARYIHPHDAAQIAEKLSPFVTIVGLFLNASTSEVEDALSSMPDMLPQFHGEETADYCDSFKRRYIKALGVGSDMPCAKDLAQYQNSVGFLFDSNEPGALGGTGHAFDWSRLEGRMQKPLVLAGGLNVDNVSRAIAEVAPAALDVSSGVELSKGVKCASTMKQFMRAVADADAQK